jgi:hypothetical protein
MSYFCIDESLLLKSFTPQGSNHAILSDKYINVHYIHSDKSSCGSDNSGLATY